MNGVFNYGLAGTADRTILVCKLVQIWC